MTHIIWTFFISARVCTTAWSTEMAISRQSSCLNCKCEICLSKWIFFFFLMIYRPFHQWIETMWIFFLHYIHSIPLAPLAIALSLCVYFYLFVAIRIKFNTYGKKENLPRKCLCSNICVCANCSQCERKPFQLDHPFSPFVHRFFTFIDVFCYFFFLYIYPPHSFDIELHFWKHLKLHMMFHSVIQFHFSFSFFLFLSLVHFSFTRICAFLFGIRWKQSAAHAKRAEKKQPYY